MNELRLMGILNTTPDSFSVRCFDDVPAALEQVKHLLGEGADIIDIGGESTRPGYTPVTVEDELARVIPVVKQIRETLPQAVLSVDTMKPKVAEEALALGVQIINDVSGMADVGMGHLVAESGCKYVYMHGFSTHEKVAKLTDSRVLYSSQAHFAQSFMDEIREGVEHVLKQGVAESQLIVDSGFGFSKRGLCNMWLLDTLPQLLEWLGDIPLLVGASRKHFVREITGKNDIVEASVAFAKLAMERGANFFRVHDVAAHKHLI